MILTKNIFIKILKSLILCFLIILSIFFIFSLISYLSESYSFIKIIYLSFLTSLQIIFYIPLFIFFLIIILFLINISAYSEIIILLHYLPKKKLLLIFSLIIFLFTIVEVNKNIFIEIFEKRKIEITSSKSNAATMIIKKNSNNHMVYYILDKINNNFIEVAKYHLIDGIFKEGLFAENLELKDENLLANKYFKLSGDKIEIFNEQTIVVDNILNLNENKTIHIQENKSFFDKVKIYNFIYYFLTASLLVIFTLNKKNFTKNNSRFLIYLATCIFFIFYSYLINSTNISSNILVFKSLNIILIIIYLIKELHNEQIH